MNVNRSYRVVTDVKLDVICLLLCEVMAPPDECSRTISGKCTLAPALRCSPELGRVNEHPSQSDLML